MYERFETQITVGWKFKKIDATNGDVSWDRYPIEFLQYYRHGKFRIGCGGTIHLNPTFDASIDLPGFQNGKLTFDNALGFIGEADYHFTEKLVCGIKATIIKYTYEGESCDGNSFGVVLGIRF